MLPTQALQEMNDHKSIVNNAMGSCKKLTDLLHEHLLGIY